MIVVAVSQTHNSYIISITLMAVATIGDVGKCCEADTAVFYIPLVTCIYCKLTPCIYRCIIRLYLLSIVDARAAAIS